VRRLLRSHTPEITITLVRVDGLKGFPEAIESVYPETHAQLCIVHMVRNSLRFVPWKDKTAVVADLETIYTATNAEVAKENLSAFRANME
jgi:putative transposase